MAHDATRVREAGLSGQGQDGSLEAWAEHVGDSYAQCCDMLIGDSRRYLGSRRDAEEAVHDLFVYLLEHPNGKTLTPPYLRTCNRHHCWRILEERRKAFHAETRIADFLRIFVHTDVQANDRFDKLVRWMRSAIRKLPRAERKVVRRVLEGISLEEIATRQRVKPDSVGRTWRRALDHLRQLARDEAP